MSLTNREMSLYDLSFAASVSRSCKHRVPHSVVHFTKLSSGILRAVTGFTALSWFIPCTVFNVPYLVFQFHNGLTCQVLSSSYEWAKLRDHDIQHSADFHVWPVVTHSLAVLSLLSFVHKVPAFSEAV